MNGALQRAIRAVFTCATNRPGIVGPADCPTLRHPHINQKFAYSKQLFNAHDQGSSHVRMCARSGRARARTYTLEGRRRRCPSPLPPISLEGACLITGIFFVAHSGLMLSNKAFKNSQFCIIQCSCEWGLVRVRARFGGKEECAQRTATQRTTRARQRPGGPAPPRSSENDLYKAAIWKKTGFELVGKQRIHTCRPTRRRRSINQAIRTPASPATSPARRCRRCRRRCRRRHQPRRRPRRCRRPRPRPRPPPPGVA